MDNSLGAAAGIFSKSLCTTKHWRTQMYVLDLDAVKSQNEDSVKSLVW